MPTPLICHFDRFEDAEAAREYLLAQGLPPQSVQLRVIADEAGPVEGNFMSGNGRPDDTRPATTEPTGVITGGAVPYDRNFRHPVARGVHLLTVEAQDDAQRERAAAVLSRYPVRAVASAGLR